jgi:hypothetical protein
MEEFKKVKLLNPLKNKQDNERLITNNQGNERLVLKKHTDALDILHKILSSGNYFLGVESRKNIFRDICIELVKDKIKDLEKKFNIHNNNDECLKAIEEANKIIEDEENFLKEILINNHKDNKKYQELIQLIFKYRLRH